jgi:hypothetical protein
MHIVVLRMPKMERNMVTMETMASRVCAEGNVCHGGKRGTLLLHDVIRDTDQSFGLICFIFGLK